MQLKKRISNTIFGVGGGGGGGGAGGGGDLQTQSPVLDRRA